LILADTSVWIDHLRSGNKEVRKHLDPGFPLSIVSPLGFFHESVFQQTLKDGGHPNLAGRDL